MKIFICCSKHFYDKIPEIKKVLEQNGHEVFMPNSFDEPFKEEEMKRMSEQEHILWKQNMILKGEENIIPVDAILVLNLEKNGFEDYIGGATFLEMHTAFRLGKKIYLFNSIPKNILEDEIHGFGVEVVNQNLNKISEVKHG